MLGTASILESVRGSLDLWVKRGRYIVRTFIGQYPALYPLFLWSRRRRQLRRARKRGVKPPDPYQSRIDVIIAGFPRSANTFAGTAFGLAQPNPIGVDSHIHVPSQVIWAAKVGIPTMVLVRDPREAVLSYVLKQPYITLKQALKEYVRFYRRVLPYHNRFIVARFEQVSTDFGGVIARLNARFRTSFQEFEHTDKNVARCFEIIEQWNRQTGSLGEIEEIPHPSRRPDPMKNELRAVFDSPDLARLRTEAYNLYEALTADE